MSDMTEWLAEALAVCDAATDGPWEADTYMTKQRRVFDIESGGLKTEPSKLYGSLSIIPSDGVYGEFDGHDAEFIAHARTGYPAALRALQAVLELQEAQAVHLATAINRILDALELTAEQQSKVPEIVSSTLRSLPVEGRDAA